MPPLPPDKVLVELTRRERDILLYVVERGQEDPEFFGAAAGADKKIMSTYMAALGAIRVKLGNA